MPTADELIVQTLEEAGVEYVIGIPGGDTGGYSTCFTVKNNALKLSWSDTSRGKDCGRWEPECCLR